MAVVLWHTRHLARLQRWLAHPLPGAVPEGQGIWDEVLAALHRLERETARREEGLADALARMRRAVQALPDGVVILDSANRIEWFNRTAEAQLQLDPGTDLGQNIANLVREPEFIDYLSSSEDSVRIARGPALALSLQLIPFGQSQKMLLSRDVTQAERVDVMRRDFVANVSHELRTPLTVLVGFLETVRELKLDPQRHARLPGHDAGAGCAHAAHHRGPAHAVGARLRAAGFRRAAHRRAAAAPAAEGRRRGAFRRTPRR